MSEWEKNESVLSHIPRVVSWTQTYLARELWQMTCECESPIEAIFALWWDVMTGLSPVFNERMKLWRQFEFAEIKGRKYRADFAVWPRHLSIMERARPYGETFKCVVIELDGHDYHERTKEQVIERNERDRVFQSEGYLVLHFSGSEIHRDPASVVAAAMDTGQQEWSRFIAAYNAKTTTGKMLP